MKTNIIKWDDSMAVRCLARCQNNHARTTYLLRGADGNKAVKTKAPPEKDVSINIVAGEWDDFQYALNSMLKKKH